MSRGSESLAVLRDRAVAGVEDLIGLTFVARLLGIPVPAEGEIRGQFATVAHLDLGGLSADARCLSGVHRAVAEQLHRLPEQQVRLDHGWSSGAGAAAIARVVDHQRRAEADLQVLRTAADTTGAAAAGLDQVMRTWYLTVARLSTPVVAGVPVAELPESIVTGRTPLNLVAEDVTARLNLLQTTAERTRSGVDVILETLDAVITEFDIDPAPPASRPDVIHPDVMHPDVIRPDIPGPADPALVPEAKAHLDEGDRYLPGTTSGLSGSDSKSDIPLSLAPQEHLAPESVGAARASGPGSENPGEPGALMPDSDLALAGDQ